MTTETAPAPTAEPKSTIIDAPAPAERLPADFMADIVGDFEAMDSGKVPEPKTEKSKPSETHKKATAKTTEKKPVEQKVEKPQEKAEVEKPVEQKSEERPESGKSYMRTLGEKYDNLRIGV